MDIAEKILVVDDEPQVLVALEDLLSEGFAIFKADSAEQARAIVDQEKDIAVVLTDQRMPRGTGDELLASLDGACDACGILLTGYADLGAVIRAVNEGRLFAYVTKPWDPSDLRVKVTNAANHFRLARQLQYEQRLLHDLMNNSPDGIYFKNVGGSFLRVNQAFAQISGVKNPQQLVGKTNTTAFAGHGPASEWTDVDARILRERKPGADMVRRYPSGEGVRWVSETVAPILDNTDTPIGLVGVARDVTERMRVQEELKSNESRLREQTELLNSILDGMDEGVVVADASGQLVFSNMHAEQLLPEPQRASSIDDWATEFGFFEMDGRTPLSPSEDPLVRAVRTGQASLAEVVVNNEHSRGRRLVISAAPLFSNAGDPSGAGNARSGAVALLRDVTEQRALEQRVAQAEKMEAIGRLAGGVAHDFNNLLGVIQGYGELVLQSIKEADVIHADVKEMLRTTERAAALTRKLLEFSRQRLIQQGVVSLTAVVRGMVEMLQRVMGGVVELNVDLADDVGQTRADVGQVEQVVMNLVINARDAMPDGGRLRVRTYNPSADECRSAGLSHSGYVAFSVADTGSGLSEETKARMFEPFFTTKPVGRGTGLGLSTVYGIVSQSEGQIRVESELGHGTMFTVYLPRIYEEAQDRVSPEHSESAGKVVGTILLVEDDPALRPMMARVLRQEGHNVLVAENAQRARRLIEEATSPIDLLLTDIVMPGENGPQLAEALRSSDKTLRVLYVSGYGKDLVRASDLEHGVVACLEKPFTPTRLLRAIQGLLTSDSLSGEAGVNQGVREEDRKDAQRRAAL